MLLYLYCTLGLFAIAQIAAFFGFGGIAVASGAIAQLLLLVFVVVLVLVLVSGVLKLNRRGAP